MTLPAGTATNGFTGALALKSKDAGGTLIYMPAYLLDPTVYDGRETVQLINNEAYPVNEVQGTAYGIINVTCPLIAGLHNADFFARAVLSGVGDTGASGYWISTIYADNQGGDGPKTYDNCKFASLRLRAMFSTQARQQIAFLDFQFISCDPESATATPLAAPAAGPLSQGKILGFGQSAFTGLSQVVSTAIEINTGLQFIDGNVAGSNPAYPSLAAGLKQNTIDGTVSYRQVRNPALTINGDGSATAAFGAVGAGVSFAQQLMRKSTNKRQAGGINYLGTPYALKSNDGTPPLVVSNL